MRTIPKKSGTEGEGSIATLRARGLRLTGPRRLVLEVVRATESHPTA
jgi:Fe2+ or Zn2+ uptake regulation protein